MKHNALHIILLLLLGLVLSGCGAHRNAQRTAESTERVETLEVRDETTVITQRHKQLQTGVSESASWRITYTYDTSKPLVAETGLPPVQSISVEGSEMVQASEQETEQHTKQVDSLQTTIVVSEMITENEKECSEVDARMGVDIEKALCGAIVLAVLSIVVYYLKSKR